MNKPTNVQHDISEAPEQPQFSLGFTANEAELHKNIVNNPLKGQGEIANRLGQQFQYPRASPDSQPNNRPGINTGES